MNYFKERLKYWGGDDRQKIATILDTLNSEWRFCSACGRPMRHRIAVYYEPDEYHHWECSISGWSKVFSGEKHDDELVGKTVMEQKPLYDKKTGMKL